MRVNSRLVLIASIAVLAAASGPGLAVECGDDRQAVACTSNAECRCGINTASNQCQAASVECVPRDVVCGNFCGDYEGVTAVCRGGQCTRALAICPADCDADTQVDIAELVTAVGMAFGSQPLAACRSVDRDGDAQIQIDELIVAVRTALDGCAAMLDRAGRRRFYDAIVTFPEPVWQVAGLGAASGAPSELSIYTGPNSTLDVSVERQGDSLTLDGHYRFTDVISGVEGAGVVRQIEDVELIEGTVTADFPPADPLLSFVLRHSTSLSPLRYAGSYAFTFDQSPGGALGESRATIELSVGSSGTALAGEGVDVLETGLPAGTVSAANCMIAPGGSLYCSGAYLSDADPVNRLRMTGRLELGAGNEAYGSGQFLAGYDPPFAVYVMGTWTAVRVGPSARSLTSALETVVQNACAITTIGPPPFSEVRALENGSYELYRSCGAGHETVADLMRHPSSADAASDFTARAGEGEVVELEGLPAGYWERPFEPASHDGRHRYLLWQLDCWVVLVHSADDTHFQIAPQPIALSESILRHTGDLLRAACTD